MNENLLVSSSRIWVGGSGPAISFPLHLRGAWVRLRTREGPFLIVSAVGLVACRRTEGGVAGVGGGSIPRRRRERRRVGMGEMVDTVGMVGMVAD